MAPPSLIRTAHGTAAEGGALLVVETPPVDEGAPADATDTATGLAIRKARGRPFRTGNAAARGKGPSVLLVNTDPKAEGEAEESADVRRRVHRRAASLKNRRRAELAILHAAETVSTAVDAELKSWSLAMAWSDHYYRLGDPIRGAAFAEKASAHSLKAIAIAEREAGSRPHRRSKDKALAQRIAEKFSANDEQPEEGGTT